MHLSTDTSRPSREPGLRHCAAALLLALAAPLASAALDAPPSSDLPATEVQRTAGTTAAGIAYTDVRVTLQSGTTVHEFVDATGTVFAVSWSGPFKPDLKALLGRHFDRLHAGTPGREADHSHLQVDNTDLVVQSSGHMGAYEGRAWVPSRLPTGFDTEHMN